MVYFKIVGSAFAMVIFRDLEKITETAAESGNTENASEGSGE